MPDIELAVGRTPIRGRRQRRQVNCLWQAPSCRPMVDEVCNDGIRTDAKRMRVIRIAGGIWARNLSLPYEDMRLPGIADPEAKLESWGAPGTISCSVSLMQL